MLPMLSHQLLGRDNNQLVVVSLQLRYHNSLSLLDCCYQSLSKVMTCFVPFFFVNYKFKHLSGLCGIQCKCHLVAFCCSKTQLTDNNQLVVVSLQLRYHNSLSLLDCCYQSLSKVMTCFVPFFFVNYKFKHLSGLCGIQCKCHLVAFCCSKTQLLSCDSSIRYIASMQYIL